MKNNFNAINNFLKNNKYIRSNKLWILINTIFSISILIFSIATMVSSNTNQTIIYGFVYIGYLISAIISVISCSLIIFNFILDDKNEFFKKWYFYLPCLMILFESIVLPIPLNFATRSNFNSGVVWSILIFSFCVMIIGLILLVLQFSIFNEIDNDTIQSPESKDDSKKMIRDIENNNLSSSSDFSSTNNSIHNNESNKEDEIIIPDSIIHND
ncbi:MAG: hypothetical protein K2I36_00495 [Ureaplasma sp.]|nr:hypothetical protein [Ureaplasma sp.]